jgi:peptidyl-prolyl cis-trans isomerase A (cyclophilin A)
MSLTVRIPACAAALAISVVVAPARAPQNPTPAARTRPAPVDLLDPSTLTERAPDTYRAIFDTSVGIFVVKVTRAWAPHGADRFYNLVKAGFYDECRFFRVVKDFVAQWGIHGDPAVSAAWERATLPVDRAIVSNTRGRVTFAQGNLASSRATQVFINFKDNSRLDINSFAPIGEVVTSMVLVERLYHQYGEGIDQGAILAGGNAWLVQAFPRLSYIKSAKIEAGH